MDKPNNYEMILTVINYVTDVHARLWEMVTTGCASYLQEKEKKEKHEHFNDVIAFSYFAVDILNERNWDEVCKKYRDFYKSSLYDELFSKELVDADDEHPTFLEYDNCLCMRFKVQTQADASKEDVEAIFNNILNEALDEVEKRKSKTDKGGEEGAKQQAN